MKNLEANDDRRIAFTGLWSQDTSSGGLQVVRGTVVWGELDGELAHLAAMLRPAAIEADPPKKIAGDDALGG